MIQFSFALLFKVVRETYLSSPFATATVFINPPKTFYSTYISYTSYLRTSFRDRWYYIIIYYYIICFSLYMDNLVQFPFSRYGGRERLVIFRCFWYRDLLQRLDALRMLHCRLLQGLFNLLVRSGISISSKMCNPLRHTGWYRSLRLLSCLNTKFTGSRSTILWVVEVDNCLVTERPWLHG